MSTKKSHIDKELFRRYLANEMTDVERNAFEKELQKYPFEAEAMDGFESVSSSNFENDLNELSQKTGNNKRKSRIPYFAAAATILLLITSGIIWMQLEHQSPVEKVSEVKIDTMREKASADEVEQATTAIREDVTEIEISEEKRDEPKVELAQTQEAIEPQKEKIETTKNLNFGKEENAVVTTHISDNKIALETIPDALHKPATENDEQVKFVTANNRAELAKVQATTAKAFNTDTLKGHIIRGLILSDSDGMPLPGAVITEKGTQNGTIADIDGKFQMALENDSSLVVASFIGMESNEFHPEKDSENIVSLTNDNVALSEVVVIGFESHQKRTLTSATRQITTDEPLNTRAAPICGMNEYKAYLKNEAVLPSDFDTKKVVVKLRLTIDNSGEIQEFENLNHADEKFFELAKNIVLNGPQWTPALRNNRKVDSTTRLRVVFKMSND